MELIYDFWLTVETLDSKDSAKIAVQFDHDLTLEDLQEFVKNQGYSSVDAYFKQWIDDEEELEDVLKSVKDNNVFLIESAIDIYCNDKKPLCEFLTKKYQRKALEVYLEKQEAMYLDL